MSLWDLQASSDDQVPLARVSFMSGWSAGLEGGWDSARWAGLAALPALTCQTPTGPLKLPAVASSGSHHDSPGGGTLLQHSGDHISVPQVMQVHLFCQAHVLMGPLSTGGRGAEA